MMNNPKYIFLMATPVMVGPNGSGDLVPLTFGKTLRNLPKTNVQLPVENNTGTNVFLPCGALFYG